MALRTVPPENDFGFIDLKSRSISGRQARGFTHRTIHIDGLATVPADQMVVIVSNAIFIERRRARGLNSPDQSPLRQQTQSVIYRLSRYRTNLTAHMVHDLVRGGMRTRGTRTKQSQALSRHLQSMIAKKGPEVFGHVRIID